MRLYLIPTAVPHLAITLSLSLLRERVLKSTVETWKK